MDFKDLHVIREMFAEFASYQDVEQLHFDKYQRKLAYKREWYRMNKARACAKQHEYYRANRERISAYDRARKNTDEARSKRRAKHVCGPSKPWQVAWYERKKSVAKGVK
jgi:ferredoxin-NADP reductase